MAQSDSPFIVKQDSNGLQIYSGLSDVRLLSSLSSKPIRCVDICENGHLLAFSDHVQIKVVTFPNFICILEKDIPAVNYVKISPRGSLLVTWSPYKSNAGGGVEGDPNLHIYCVTTGELLQSFVQKKMSQWCPNWTFNEEICARHLNSELLFYENNKFNAYVKKLVNHKVADFSLSTNKRTGIHYVSSFTQGVKGQPSCVRVYQYPRFEGSVIATKSFYKADNVTFLWNNKGDAMLLVCAVDVDKSGKSYYGEQNLHYMDITGQTNVVKLSKEGPIYSTAWTPSTKKESLFCVVYGFMPAKATLFNCKSEVVFEFGEPTKLNQVVFNPFGNLVALAGFGNLREGVYVWDVNRRCLIAKFKCPETTDFSWCPDGKHILTATTSPRLRVGNGFKIWKFDGTQLYNWPEQYSSSLEVYKVLWRPTSDDSLYPEPDISSIVPLQTTAKAQAAEPAKYVPPHLRKPGTNVKPSTEPSKNSTLTEREKKIRTVEKKLEQIAKLKEQRDAGKSLEKNQLDKILKEDELEQELVKLKLS